MKTKLFTLPALLLLTASLAGAATNDVSSLLQKGLFEEEANRNLDAAIQAYQSVILQTDKDRKFAATAVFRLGECFRKQGKASEATAQYQRILREFPDQQELVKLSQQQVGPAAAAISVGNSESTGGWEQPLATAKAASPPAAAQPPIDPEAEEIKTIQAMIKDNPDLINAMEPGANSQTPLNAAVANGHLKVAKFLLENHADVNAKGSGGLAPLHIAAQANNKAMVELLLTNGADIKNKSEFRGDGKTPLQLAAQAGYRSMAELLLQNGADVNATADNSGQSALHLAVQKGYTAVAELLIANGANVNMRDRKDVAALNISIMASQLPMIELLLAHGADINAKGSNGSTALMQAVEAGKLEIAKLLLQHGADVDAVLGSNPPERAGQTALFLAVLGNQNPLVKLLLEHKANPNAKATYSLSNYNLNHGGTSAFPFASAYAGLTPLLVAIHQHQKETVDLLLKYHADINLKDDIQTTPLLLAVDRADQDMVELLLAHKPDLQARYGDGYTALHTAAMHGEKTILSMLLASGANVSAVDDNGMTPLHLAVSRGLEPAELLIQHGANVNAMDKFGKTPADYLSSNSMRAEDVESIDKLLRQHGGFKADEVSTIRVTRNGLPAPMEVFRQDKGSQDHFTLFEVIAKLYQLQYQTQFSGQQPGLPFPDFAKVKIHHLAARDQKKEAKDTAVDLEALLNSGDCSGDIPLAWGDVVEIPEQDHIVAEQWRGLSAEVKKTLNKCLIRRVTLLIKGEKIPMILGPGIFLVREISESLETAERGSSASKVLNSFWLRDAVMGANVLRASSDLSRVKVTRLDPATKKNKEMLFNLDSAATDNFTVFMPQPRRTPGLGLPAPPAPMRVLSQPGIAPWTSPSVNSGINLWLRDGDIIEIPEKP